MPSARQRGRTSDSALRSSSEYSFWSAAMGPAAAASSSWPAVRLETPSARALPDATSAAIAATVSPIGVTSSGQW